MTFLECVVGSYKILLETCIIINHYSDDIVTENIGRFVCLCAFKFSLPVMFLVL